MSKVTVCIFLRKYGKISSVNQKEVYLMPKKAKTTKKSADSDSVKKAAEKEAVGTR